MTDYDLDWSRVELLIKTWPGANPLGPDRVDAYLDAYAYPNGRDRASRTDPVELERVLVELRGDDAKGERPTSAVVKDAIVRDRFTRSPGLVRALADEVDEPAEDWALAHALATHSPIAKLMRHVAERHGRPTNPPHLPESCPQCSVDAAERAEVERLHAEYGPEWRNVTAALDEQAAHAAQLDVEYPWRLSEDEKLARGLPSGRDRADVEAQVIRQDG
jgi:hypothetical protein